jgi:hypothetical protein
LLLVAPRAPEKKRETPEWANSLQKKRVKIEAWLVQEKLPEQLPEQLAVSSVHAGTRSPRPYPDAHTKPTTQM